MRKKLRMTYVGYKRSRGYMGHYQMNYNVDNVIDVESGKILCKDYTFRDSKVFKGMGLKNGDIVEMTVNVKIEENSNIKLSYPKEVKKVESYE